MTLTLQNVDKNLYEIIKNLATIQPNLKVQIDNDKLSEYTHKSEQDTKNARHLKDILDRKKRGELECVGLEKFEAEKAEFFKRLGVDENKLLA